MSLKGFFKTFGHDMEISERRQKQQCEAQMRQWFQNYGGLLAGAYDDAAESADRLSGGNPEFRRAAEKAFLYQLLLGAKDGSLWHREISGGGTAIPRYYFRPYQQLLVILLQNRGSFCSSSAAAASIEKRTPLFREEGELTESSCGTFWKAMLPYLENTESEQLDTILAAMARGYVFYHGNMEERDYVARLEENLRTHRSRQPRPVVTNLPKSSWGMENNDFDDPDEFKSYLLKTFPTLKEYFTDEVLGSMDTAQIFGELYPKKPKLVIEMWRSLLDHFEERLYDQKQAECIIFDIMEEVWTGDCPLGFIYDALERDDRFIRQLFDSAYIGYPQQELLTNCPDYSTCELEEKLQKMLDENPFFEGFH